jgi:hypothetical protein
MKFYLKPILSVFALAVLLGYSGCGGKNNPGPSVEEVQLGKLTTVWKVGSTGDVTLGGVSKKADYADFTLTLTGVAGATSYSYVKTGGPSLTPWPSAGTWKFGTDPEKDLIRDPGVAGKELQATYTVTDNTLEITFSYAGTGEATRTNEVKGQWVFTLTK